MKNMAGPDGNEFRSILKSDISKTNERNSTLENGHTIFRFKTQVVWKNVIGMLTLHLLGFYGLYLAMQNLTRVKLGTIIWSFALNHLGLYGTTIGAHRYWTHRTFKAKLPLRVILMALQTLSAQNCIYIWVRDHRMHHKYSDTDADPHNANRGFFFSHMGWLMMKKHPDVARKGRTIDMSDMKNDPLVMFQMKYYYYLYFLIGFLIPVGVPVWLWNEDLGLSFYLTLIKSLFLWHGTWCVNSVAHFYGNQPFDKNIFPRDTTTPIFFGSGEGWHNYHHCFPWDYKAAELKSDYNISKQVIELFEKIGWAYDLKVASSELVLAKAKRSGDGTWIKNDRSNEDVNCNVISKKKEFDLTPHA